MAQICLPLLAGRQLSGPPQLGKLTHLTVWPKQMQFRVNFDTIPFEPNVRAASEADAIFNQQFHRTSFY